MNRILFELGFEELPVNEIKILFEYFSDNFQSRIDKQKIKYKSLNFFNTPRRFSILIQGIDERTAIEEKIIKGPPEHIFYKNGEISKQGIGFLKSKNLREEDIRIEKGFIIYNKKVGGDYCVDIIKDILIELLQKIPFTKTMKWPNSDIRFSRPIRWIVFLFNNSIVDFQFANIKAGKKTSVNRAVENTCIDIDIDNYIKTLKKHYVLLNSGIDKGDRYDFIMEQMKKMELEREIDIVRDKELITENALLTEYPVLYIGSFDKRFLNLPDSILMAAMKQHQRYFSIKDKDNKLINKFVFISNNPNAKYEDIRKNNEKVLIARLEDAEFYYHNDIKIKLDEYEKKLKDIVFYNNLGSYYDKIIRIGKISEYIDSILNSKNEDWKKLALIAKFDIATEMIKDGKEFTKLQGIIGYYYAMEMGFDENVCIVSKEHYLPKTKNDTLPQNYNSIVLSIADKIDNIVGAFIAGYKPTGSKDIMGVRRDSLSLLYLLHSIQDKYEFILNIEELLKHTFYIYNNNSKDIEKESLSYLIMRMEYYCAELLNVSIDIIRAAINSRYKIIGDIIKKIELLNKEKQNNDFKTLVIGMKRVANIIKDFIPERTIKDYAYSEKYEMELLNNAKTIENNNKILYEKKQFELILKNLLNLRESIDNFFDNILVMHNDKEIRLRRKTLLYYVKGIFDYFADFSKIVFENEKS